MLEEVIASPEIAMAAPIPLRSDFDASRLRRLAKSSRDPDQTRRLLALAAIYDGATRTQAARIGCVTLQIVRDWVLRFNTAGPQGVVTGRAPGSRPLLNAEQRQALQHIVEAVRSRRFTVWCAGAWSISSPGCGRSSVSPSPSRR
jgi:putative transposase